MLFKNKIIVVLRSKKEGENKMNNDVLDHIIKWCKEQLRYCESGILIHDGDKESALETYEKVIKTLTDMMTHK